MCLGHNQDLLISESVEAADVNHKDMEFLYTDGETWHFMDPNSYEQIEIGANEIGDAKKWLVGQETCEIILWDEKPIQVDPPVNVELKIFDGFRAVPVECAWINWDNACNVMSSS